jgi:hypothetical protein
MISVKAVASSPTAREILATCPGGRSTGCQWRKSVTELKRRICCVSKILPIQTRGVFFQIQCIDIDNCLLFPEKRKKVAIVDGASSS